MAGRVKLRVRPKSVVAMPSVLGVGPALLRQSVI